MKRTHGCFVVIITGLLVVASAGLAHAAEAVAAPEKKEEAPPQPKLDKIKIDVKQKRIEVMGRFCLKEGILDYLGVTAGGQEYESVTALNCSGSRLHAALLAIGAVPGPSPQMMELIKKNPPKDRPLPKRTGTALVITAEWTAGGKTVSVPATQLLINRKEKKPQTGGRWTFTGSHFAKDENGKQFYMADIDRALISVVYMAAAVVNFNLDAGNPYAAEDEGYEANTKLIPKEDTPVKLIITLAKQKND